MTTAPTAPASAAGTEEDPWGHTMPRGTVVGFMLAMLHQDYECTGMYLETRVVGEERDTLVRQLEAILDRLPGTIDNVSRNPEWDVPDGRHARLQPVGTVEINGEQHEIVLSASSGQWYQPSGCSPPRPSVASRIFART